MDITFNIYNNDILFRISDYVRVFNYIQYITILNVKYNIFKVDVSCLFKEPIFFLAPFENTHTSYYAKTCAFCQHVILLLFYALRAFVFYV